MSVLHLQARVPEMTIEDALTAAFFESPLSETKQEWSYIGSTAAVALLLSPDSGFGFAKDGAAVRLTTDHKAPDKA